MSEMTYSGNIGFLFQHIYYQKIRFLSGKDDVGNKDEFNYRNSQLFGATVQLSDPLNDLVNTRIPLVTTYPGLIAGSGYTHETRFEGELKLGFSFDYTSGMPVIPGSSVKGLLRAAVEDEDLFSIILDQLSKPLQQKLEEEASRLRLVKQLFENPEAGSYATDIFFDAVITGIRENNFSDGGSAYNQKRLLGPDTLCPHRDPLKNPVPISFLKVMPEVIFEFRFRLIEGIGFTAADKEELFKVILLTCGAGAKTNVGYGQYTDLLKG